MKIFLIRLKTTGDVVYCSWRCVPSPTSNSNSLSSTCNIVDVVFRFVNGEPELVPKNRKNMSDNGSCCRCCCCCCRRRDNPEEDDDPAISSLSSCSSSSSAAAAENNGGEFLKQDRIALRNKGSSRGITMGVLVVGVVDDDDDGEDDDDEESFVSSLSSL